MAALLLVQFSLHSNHTNTNTNNLFFQLRRPTSRTKFLVANCRSRLPASNERMEHNGEEDGKEKKLWGMMEIGRMLKESMSPKHKGDWKDLVLMSLSFAVYVYISQRIVCTYCAWMSILKHSSF